MGAMVARPRGARGVVKTEHSSPGPATLAGTRRAAVGRGDARSSLLPQMEKERPNGNRLENNACPGRF